MLSRRRSVPGAVTDHVGLLMYPSDCLHCGVVYSAGRTATHIDVTLSPVVKGRVVCEICDNGRGFESWEARLGTGLTAMRERAEALGGSLEVSSAPDCGTKIIVTLPA